ncbi:MAG: GTPase Obg [Verrucomicrobiota bacterium]
MFVDHIKIKAKAGDGGNGVSSFRREKFYPKGGPDGGDGGNGGDVVLIVDHHKDNLREFFYKPNYKAEKGAHGQGQKKTGKSGKDLVLKVPPGTMVYRIEPPEPKVNPDDEWLMDGDGSEYEEILIIENADGEVEAETQALTEGEDIDPEVLNIGLANIDDEDIFDPEEDGDLELEEEDDDSPGELVADLTEIGQKFVLCEGGVGGKGNWHFRSPTNQAPIEFTKGTPGGEDWFYLELRQIADVGLVGFPNAGKSTLLTSLSNATPKVAAYPFTTLKPMVGVVDFPGFHRCTVADIPGLIEGAHANVGLGHDFLRHISRCSVFMFVVDCAAVDQRDPISDLEILRTELKLFDEALTEREWIIVANKIDLEEHELFLEPIKNRFPKKEIFPISAQTGEGLDALRERLCEMVGQRPE